MFNSKIFFSLVAVSFIVLSNPVQSAVYDFGNLQTASRLPTISNVSFNDNEIVNSLNFGYSPIDQLQNSYISNNHVSIAATSVYGSNASNTSGLSYIDSGRQFQGGIYNRLPDVGLAKRSNKYTPVASPVPEPEIYGMILAGLALIGFTARRRKQDS